MSCQGCADSLKGLFDKEPGVHSANVSFDTTIAELEFDPDSVTLARLSEIVAKAGFEVV